MLTFITGPVRSGKSALAQRLAERSGRHVLFCATATIDADDEEWNARIERHRAERPKNWTVIETAVPQSAGLLAALAAAAENDTVVVDSLGTWIADMMGLHPLGTSVVEWNARIEGYAMQLDGVLEKCAADVVVVSEEVGWGVVPVHVSGRVFRDVIGRANRRLCARADRAYLLISGVALDLKKALPFETIG
ncbi:MAG: bifunctional adenosylcobinamide kinase/adenosylcobinamide-phosphate guanylyltransferase [Vulcanimicrobiaceae bacterium]